MWEKRFPSERHWFKNLSNISVCFQNFILSDSECFLYRVVILPQLTLLYIFFYSPGGAVMVCLCTPPRYKVPRVLLPPVKIPQGTVTSR